MGGSGDASEGKLGKRGKLGEEGSNSPIFRNLAGVCLRFLGEGGWRFGCILLKTRSFWFGTAIALRKCVRKLCLRTAQAFWESGPDVWIRGTKRHPTEVRHPPGRFPTYGGDLWEASDWPLRAGSSSGEGRWPSVLSEHKFIAWRYMAAAFWHKRVVAFSCTSVRDRRSIGMFGSGVAGNSRSCGLSG